MLLYQFLSARVDGLIDYIDETGTNFVVDYARLDQPPAEVYAQPEPAAATA